MRSFACQTQLICVLPLFLAGPAAADGKGLEGVETKILAKLCGAESFAGGSQEPPVSGKHLCLLN